MLDTRMNYSCGYWNDAATLDQAQAAKLDLTCRKLRLEPGMRVLDIGCGWGGFARFAAERYGARVVGISVSENQVAMAREWCRGLPIEILLRDYRDVHGDFDRVVSMGMFGRESGKNHGEFMQVANRCLPNGGLCVMDGAGDNGIRAGTDPWVEKHIFPDDLIPSTAQTGTAVEGQFVMEDWHNLSADYDRTLCAWCANFESQWHSACACIRRAVRTHVALLFAAKRRCLPRPHQPDGANRAVQGSSGALHGRTLTDDGFYHLTFRNNPEKDPFPVP